MSSMKYLLLFLAVTMTAPVSASVLLPTDNGISGADCTIFADEKGDKKEDGKDGKDGKEEEPDCE